MNFSPHNKEDWQLNNTIINSDVNDDRKNPIKKGYIDFAKKIHFILINVLDDRVVQLI